MNKKRVNEILKKSMVIMTFSIGTLLSMGIMANASNMENEFNNFLNKYNNKKIIVENGISLRDREQLNLKDYKNLEISNNNVLEIENGVVKTKGSGTAYLSITIDKTVHIIEIYVPQKTKYERGTDVQKKVNRNYYKVFIDPGHGGSDNGSSGNGILEDDLNLRVALKVRDILINKGIEVKMSRTSDVFLGLNERAYMANEYGADVFFSAHTNAAETSNAYGIETYYHRNKGSHRPLSENIHSKAINNTGAYNRGVRNANFAVLRESTMPSTLFEIGFLSNFNEANNLKSEEYQNKLANAAADGIEKYLKENIILDGAEDGVINQGIVTASSLNVRSAASTNSSVLGSLSNGAKVSIVAKLNGWYRIRYGSSYGYVSSDYVKIVDGDTSIPKPPPETINKKGKVVASKLNIRSSASTSSSVIGSLSNGQTVEIINTQNGWHKIKCGNSYGYVSADYIKILEEDTNVPKPPPEIVNKKGKITASKLNVRSSASTSAKVIGSLSNGQTVEIINTQNGWHKIKYGSSYGYVSAQYVNITGDEVKPTPPSTSVVLGTVTASKLNIRSNASTSASVIGSLNKGQAVEIIGTQNGWYKIKYGTKHGYVSAEYVKKENSENKPTIGNNKSGIVTATSLNIREGRGTNSLVIGSLKKGDRVTIVETRDGWHKIRYGYGYGYVSSNYIKL